MSWLIYGALSGLFEFLKDIKSKKALKSCDEYVLTWAQIVFGYPISLAIFAVEGFPDLPKEMFPVLTLQIVFLTLSLVLYARAIKLSDLSLAVPIAMFSPLFLLFTAPIMLGEFAPSTGFFGVVLIVIGGYVLNIQTRHIGYLEPLKALVNTSGPRLMLVVALIFSVTANFDKMGIALISPLHWLAFVQLGMGTLMTIFVVAKVKNVFSVVKNNFSLLFLVGTLNALMAVFYILGLMTGLVAYIVSLKRLSVLLTVAYGALVLKEQGIKERLTGALIMIAGVIFIALG